MSALQDFLDTWNDGMLASHVGASFSCREVEALAALFEEYGYRDAAQTWREEHSYGDDDPDFDQHYDLNPNNTGTSHA